MALYAVGGSGTRCVQMTLFMGPPNQSLKLTAEAEVQSRRAKEQLVNIGQRAAR